MSPLPLQPAPANPDDYLPAEYPEHEKLRALGGANQIIGDFLDWLGTTGYSICAWDEEECGYRPTRNRIIDWIGTYFDIDPAKLSNEKDKMIRVLRAQNGEKN